MKSKLIYYGHPMLRKKCKPVEALTPEVLQFAQEMIDFVLDKTNKSMGLSANQLANDMRIFVTFVPVEQEDGKWTEGEMLVFINPILSNPSPEREIMDEGCISIPGLYIPIERPCTIDVEATNMKGETFKFRCHGLLAKCVMHENDHLNGVLTIDRTDNRTKKQIAQRLNEIKKKFN